MLSSLRIPVLLAALTGGISGCAAFAPTTSGVARAPQITTAWFAESPDRLAAAAREACSAPGETFVQPRPGVAQCRLLLDPPTTAAVILNYDGTIDDLPQLVISLTTLRAKDGHLVTGCAFLKVPRKDGRISRIVQNDRAVAAKLRQMFDAMGGKPVRDVPPESVERCFSL